MTSKDQVDDTDQHTTSNQLLYCFQLEWMFIGSRIRRGTSVNLQHQAVYQLSMNIVNNGQAVMYGYEMNGNRFAGSLKRGRVYLYSTVRRTNLSAHTMTNRGYEWTSAPQVLAPFSRKKEQKRRGTRRCKLWVSSRE